MKRISVAGVALKVSAVFFQRADMVTSDGPPTEWAAHMARKPDDPPTITLSPYTVELLCGGRCRWCDELRAENAALRAAVTELETRRAFADVGAH